VPHNVSTEQFYTVKKGNKLLISASPLHTITLTCKVTCSTKHGQLQRCINLLQKPKYLKSKIYMSDVHMKKRVNAGYLKWKLVEYQVKMEANTLLCSPPKKTVVLSYDCCVVL
jgi:hypothetical protein